MYRTGPFCYSQFWPETQSWWVRFRVETPEQWSPWLEVGDWPNDRESQIRAVMVARRLPTLLAERGMAVNNEPWMEQLPAIAVPESPGVYVVQGTVTHVKIGRASNIARRIRELQTGSPVPLRLVAVLSNEPKNERVFHQRWKLQRESGGEWFRVTADMKHVFEVVNNAASLTG